MEVVEKNKIVNNLLECIGEVVERDSDDSGQEDILIGLIDLCKKATFLPTIKKRRQLRKPWIKDEEHRGSFSFLTKELLLTDEASFRNYLRLSKQQFQFLLTLVEQDIRRSNTILRDAISPAEKLAICLRFLTTGESFRSIDHQTRVSKSAISLLVPEVCGAIFRRLKETYLKFPQNPSEWEAIAREFDVKWQFPNCMGALDGKHINFRPLRKDEKYYNNYKGTNSIVLLALVDAHCKFIFVDVGCNDAEVFIQSKLSKILQEGKEIPQNAIIGNGRCLPYVVIGNNTFPMQNHLLTPYPYQTTSSEKQTFNIRLSRARNVVEHAYTILSTRFRIFLSPMHLKVETVKIITFACCALHNYLLQTDSTYMGNNENILSETSGILDSVYNPPRGAKEAIRKDFAQYFTNEGKLNWI